MKASIVTRAALALLGATLLVPAAMAEDAIPPDEEVPKSCPLSLESSCSAKVIVWARNPSTDDCCMYLNPCSAPSGWETYNSILECQDA
jgi:hypothetical protein